MRTVLGVTLGVLVCLSGPFLGYPALRITQWGLAYAAVCLLTNFLGGLVLARYAGAGAYICAGFVAFAQCFFSTGLIGAAVWSRQFENVVVFSLVWVVTVFVGIFIYLWKVRRQLTHT